ncbi:MAG: preprotein translocase subunit SecE [Clostridiales bacterium]|jgi:preprotein translocase subunit SecE|nr:preprotein translocase subunit SecE [Clostridiales bacterium]
MSDKKKNPFQGIVTYFKEVRAELKKVVWPTLKQIQNNTVIVIICLVFVGAVIWVLDLGFKTTLGKAVDLAEQSQTTENVPIQPDLGDMEGLNTEDLDMEGLNPEDLDSMELDPANIESTDIDSPEIVTEETPDNAADASVPQNNEQ